MALHGIQRGEAQLADGAVVRGYKHVFSVSIDSFDVLAELDHEPTKDPPEVDFGFPFLNHAAGRVAIWVNADEPRFVDTTLAATVALDRGEGRILYVGIHRSSESLQRALSFRGRTHTGVVVPSLGYDSSGTSR